MLFTASALSCPDTCMPSRRRFTPPAAAVAAVVGAAVVALVTAAVVALVVTGAAESVGAAVICVAKTKVGLTDTAYRVFHSTHSTEVFV